MSTPPNSGADAANSPGSLYRRPPAVLHFECANFTLLDASVLVRQRRGHSDAFDSPCDTRKVKIPITDDETAGDAIEGLTTATEGGGSSNLPTPQSSVPRARRDCSTCNDDRDSIPYPDTIAASPPESHSAPQDQHPCQDFVLVVHVFQHTSHRASAQYLQQQQREVRSLGGPGNDGNVADDDAATATDFDRANFGDDNRCDGDDEEKDGDGEDSDGRDEVVAARLRRYLEERLTAAAVRRAHAAALRAEAAAKATLRRQQSATRRRERVVCREGLLRDRLDRAAAIRTKQRAEWQARACAADNQRAQRAADARARRAALISEHSRRILPLLDGLAEMGFPVRHAPEEGGGDVLHPSASSGAGAAAPASAAANEPRSPLLPAVATASVRAAVPKVTSLYSLPYVSTGDVESEIATSRSHLHQTVGDFLRHHAAVAKHLRPTTSTASLGAAGGVQPFTAEQQVRHFVACFHLYAEHDGLCRRLAVERGVHPHAVRVERTKRILARYHALLAHAVTLRLAEADASRSSSSLPPLKITDDEESLDATACALAFQVVHALAGLHRSCEMLQNCGDDHHHHHHDNDAAAAVSDVARSAVLRFESVWSAYLRFLTVKNDSTGQHAVGDVPTEKTGAATTTIDRMIDTYVRLHRAQETRNRQQQQQTTTTDSETVASNVTAAATTTTPAAADETDARLSAIDAKLRAAAARREAARSAQKNLRHAELTRAIEAQKRSILKMLAQLGGREAVDRLRMVLQQEKETL